MVLPPFTMARNVSTLKAGSFFAFTTALSVDRTKIPRIEKSVQLWSSARL
jgi:hypothetical protein